MASITRSFSLLKLFGLSMGEIVDVFKLAVIETDKINHLIYEVQIDSYSTCDDQTGSTFINLKVDYHLVHKNQTSRYTKEDLQAEFGEQLDDLVHDMFSQRASEVNNGGIDSQIEFLIEDGFTDVIEIGNYLRGKLA